MTTPSCSSNVWVYLGGALAGLLLLGLFFLVPLVAVTGFWLVLFIIVVVLIVILALAAVVGALRRLLRSLRFLS